MENFNYRQFYLMFIFICSVFLIIGCSGGGETHHWIGEGQEELTVINVTPANSSVASGFTRQFTATGIYSDGTSKDITDSVTWSSDDETVATVNPSGAANSGLATGISTGTAVITATLAGKSGSANLTVTAATLSSIAVTPVNPSVSEGFTRQFTATGTYSDGTSENITASVTWKSSDINVATMNVNFAADSGLATGISAGTAVITATLAGKSGSTNLTVTDATLSSIAVTPTNPSVVSGLTRQFTATGTLSDGTSENITALVTWSSGDINVATMNPNFTADSGLATGISTGTAVITATLAGKSGSTNLTVTDATLSSIAVTPIDPSVVSGLTKQFAATGTYSDGTSENITALVTWSSGDINVATMNPNFTADSGLATGKSAGTSIITAALDGKSGSTTLTVTAATLDSIAVTPIDPSVVSGLTRQFAATGTYTDGSVADITALVTWTSGNIDVATMNANFTADSGLATGKSAGTSIITATLDDKSGSTTLTVTAATLDSIAVTPIDPSVVSGLTRQFAATGTYTDDSVEDITALVTWTSGNIDVATMNPNFTADSGLATGKSAGTSIITAALDGKSGSTTLTVTDGTLVSIAVTPIDPSVSEGLTKQFTATGTYTDGSDEDITTLVTWTSADTNVATMNPNFEADSGLATGVNVGESLITATLESKSGNTTLTVTAAPVVNLGLATTFGIASAAGVTNTAATDINGDAVLNPDATCNAVTVDVEGGFGDCGGAPPTISGKVISSQYSEDVTPQQVTDDLRAAYIALTPAEMSGGTPIDAPTTLGTGSTGKNTFTPGVYTSATSILITGDLTLDAQGDPNASFVFQSESTIGTASGARILLVGEAKASNVWWQAGSSVTLGTDTIWQGNILADTSITMNTRATSCGRQFAGAITVTGAFVFDSNVVSVPGDANAPPTCQ